MSKRLPPMEQHLVLAIEHHKHLLEVAQRQRLAASGPRANRTLRWRNLLGDLLIRIGQRLKADIAESRPDSVTNTVWG